MFLLDEVYLSAPLKISCFLILVLFATVLLGVGAGQFGLNHIHLWTIQEHKPPMRMATLAKDLFEW